MIENLIGKIYAEILESDTIIYAHEEDFNIFQITRIGEKEVTLHSRFIAELLNPRGTHKMDDVFLVHFMKMINSHLERNHDFNQINNFSGINVYVEKSIGLINEDFTKGGSIDILLRFNNGNYLIIENKIYAGDQKGQLRRYYNAFLDSPKVMVYLTLDGMKAHD